MSTRTAAASVLHWVSAVALACVLAPLALTVEAAGVAMITDLQGKAMLSTGPRPGPVSILAEMDSGAKVELAAGATLVALYLDSGDEYAFKGPATIDFRPGEPGVPSGSKPEKRSLQLGRDGKLVRIKPVGMTQGAVVMRGIRPDARIQLVSLNRTRTLDAEPTFQWREIQPGLKYAFELRDTTGRVLYESEVAGTSLKLPGNVQLTAGAPYTWEVSTRLSDGRKYSSSAEFAVATAEVRAEAEALRPSASAALSTRIAYAAWLDQMELKDEARKYWQAAATERPEDARLKALVGS